MVTVWRKLDRFVEVRSRTILGFLALAFGLAIVAFFFLEPQQPDGAKLAPSAMPRGPTVLEAPISIPSRASENAPANPGQQGTPAWTTSRIFAAFASAQDLRVFVENAKRHPEAGGIYYAEKALGECRMQRSPEFVAQREAARQSLRNQTQLNQDTANEATAWFDGRCKAFTDAELSYAELKSLKGSREALADPLQQLRLAVSKKPTGDLTAEERDIALGKLLATRDPALLTDFLPHFFANGKSPNADSTIFVNQVPYGGLEDFEKFQLAWRLMTCKVSQTCEVKDVEVVRYCAFQGVCTSSVADSVKAAAGPGYSRVLAVADRLTQIVDAGDVSAFAAPL